MVRIVKRRDEVCIIPIYYAPECFLSIKIFNAYHGSEALIFYLTRILHKKENLALLKCEVTYE